MKDCRQTSQYCNSVQVSSIHLDLVTALIKSAARPLREVKRHKSKESSFTTNITEKGNEYARRTLKVETALKVHKSPDC